MANLEKLAERSEPINENSVWGNGSAGTGSIAFKDDWKYRPGKPMKSRAAKLQSVARPKKFIPIDKINID